jgi:AcrR family transcriptional regulator
VSTNLPPGIAAAWGIRGPTKGPRPKLTLHAVVRAGIEIADEEGLDAVSMQRVAKRLNASPMGLYRYVASKDELLTLMLDAALGTTPPPERQENWRDGLERCARVLAEAMRAHPWTPYVPVSGPPLGPNSVAWFDQALRSLGPTGLDEGEKASVVLMVSGYVSNHVRLMGQVHERFLAAAASPDEAMRSWAGALRSVAAPARFPALHAVLDAGVFDRADPPEEEFAFGLERILDGVEVLVRRRQSTSS